jgi:hypothetical protein
MTEAASKSQNLEVASMAENRPSVQSQKEDDFQQAAREAEAEAGLPGWFEMSPSEQTRAIYSKLRRIDAARSGEAPRSNVVPLPSVLPIDDPSISKPFAMVQKLEDLAKLSAPDVAACYKKIADGYKELASITAHRQSAKMAVDSPRPSLSRPADPPFRDNAVTQPTS